MEKESENAVRKSVSHLSFVAQRQLRFLSVRLGLYSMPS